MAGLTLNGLYLESASPTTSGNALETVIFSTGFGVFTRLPSGSLHEFVTDVSISGSYTSLATTSALTGQLTTLAATQALSGQLVKDTGDTMTGTLTINSPYTINVSGTNLGNNALVTYYVQSGSFSDPGGANGDIVYVI
jgi:hypothetical protein